MFGYAVPYTRNNGSRTTRRAFDFEGGPSECASFLFAFAFVLFIFSIPHHDFAFSIVDEEEKRISSLILCNQFDIRRIDAAAVNAEQLFDDSMSATSE